jgi:hypothetical protein
VWEQKSASRLRAAGENLTQLLEGNIISYLHIESNIPTSITEGTFISLNCKPPLKIIKTLGFQPAKSIP